MNWSDIPFKLFGRTKVIHVAPTIKSAVESAKTTYWTRYIIKLEPGMYEIKDDVVVDGSMHLKDGVTIIKGLDEHSLFVGGEK